MYGSIAIVGASLAGSNAAETLRREGFDGTITVVDADPATPYDRPPLSKQVLAGTWDVDKITLPAARPDADHGIDWRLGQRVAELELGERRLRLADGSRVAFDGLVIASGASARTLPGAGEISGVHVLRSLADCLAIRDALDGGAHDVVVIGAGFIGAEVAATCRQRGCTVTILEAADVPFERSLGAQLGPLVADLHRDHGVDVRLGVGVAGFDADGTDPVTGAPQVSAVRLADGSTVPATLVVVGIGVSPNVDWLAGTAALSLDDGVVTDASLLAAPGVVAAGDIARWPSRRFGQLLRIEHWETAIQMGEHAGRTLLAQASGGEPEPFDPVPWFWSDMFDRKIQLAGRSGPDHEVEVVIGSTEERRFVALYGRAGRVEGVLGWNRPRHVMQLRPLVEDGVAWHEGLERARALA